MPAGETRAATRPDRAVPGTSRAGRTVTIQELRRIRNAIVRRNKADLQWALAECELRKKPGRMAGLGRSAYWYRIEKKIGRLWPTQISRSSQVHCYRPTPEA